MQGMRYRTLGSMGEKVSAIGIGRSQIGLNGVDEQLSIRIIRTGVNCGINFMDKGHNGFQQKEARYENSYCSYFS